MTRASLKVPSDYYDGLPTALWRPANLPRLPSDAPAELKKHTVEVNDPKKVYVLYRAQRRHDFQDLVQRFENQLVYGCRAKFCDEPTCFTCAKRVAGKAPIRRFHDTSARTLAYYLASQENPERNLCRHPSATPSEISVLDKRSRSKSSATKRNPRSLAYIDAAVQTSLGPDTMNLTNGQVVVSKGDLQLRQDGVRSALLSERIERLKAPQKKDSKSFIQSLYGTVSLKMLDWLTPQGLYALSSPESNAESLQRGESSSDSSSNQLTTDMKTSDLNAPKTNSMNSSGAFENSTTKSTESETVLPTTRESHRDSKSQAVGIAPNGGLKTEPHTPEAAPQSPTTIIPPKSRTIIVPSQPTTSQTESSDSDILSTLMHEKPTKPSLIRRRSSKKSHRLSASRPITSIVDLNVSTELSEIDPVPKGEVGMKESTKDAVKPEQIHGNAHESDPEAKSCRNHDESMDNSCLQPETLSLLTPEIVELFCNLMQDHNLCESHDLIPTVIDSKLRRIRSDVSRIKFKSDFQSYNKDASCTKTEWKKFIEQSFFYVLSNPEELLQSFLTEQGSIMDSLSMWYLMVRLTRVAPTLVFDSLWNSSSMLFRPPKELQSRYSRISRLRTNADTETTRSLRSSEAANLVLVYFHALIAAMPLKWENKLGAKASSWSRVFNGERRAVLGEPSPGVYRRRLRYYDAFTNEPALRLARRLFSGISCVIRYEDLASIERGEHSRDTQTHVTLFDVLMEYIESSQISKESTAATLLDFSHERTLDFSQESSDSAPLVTASTYHDLSKQMIEWARTVILQEWKGEVEVSKDGVFGGALAFMSAMYQNQEKVTLNDSDFVVEHFAGRINTMDVPVEWLSFTPNRKTLHLLDHPYLFKASSLVDYFRSINLHRMRKAFEAALNYNSRVNMAMAQGRLMTDPNDRQHLIKRLRTALTKYLVLEIRRDRVLQDAFDQLWRRELRELLRPFKVKLGEELGEEGVDLGGVQQEFFRLAIAEALDPKYGTFTMDERTKMTWFVPSSITPLWRCELIGLIVSLAVYNGLTLPVTFPQAMYRKLLGIESTEIDHIEDGWPELAKGLTTLLEWDEEKDGNVADVFARTYEFSVDSFGKQISQDMSESSSTWPQFSSETANPMDAPLVDGSNRQAYVKDYIRYLTDVSIRPQFEAFKSGFYTCLDRRSLSLFEPHILQTVVEGVQEIDISELRRNTRYVGWHPSNRTVQHFWSIVKRYDFEMKKKLLEFVTASDRVPVGGMGNLNFVLQKNGAGDSKRLPTSYTCFSTLLLPEYDNKELLGQNLGIAINNAKGFGFA